MRIAVLILVILGAAASFILGIKWLSDFSAYKAEIAAVSELSEEISSDPEIAKAMKDVVTLKNCAYVLLAGGIVALAAVFLMGKLGKISAVIILAAGIVPAFFSPMSLAFTWLLLLGGILAFFVKPKVQAVQAE
ncbi:hypothetical protein SAMN02745823_03324 [Sporobacter termitidis DSM 10068]|uniref:DUF4064 domain-containing protein n=1 Tax=Sporobacter termitidis DSM 10068 TaxID=1123282 RepID=A0A1M5Z781_9FIRM|nr:hypothetical protein [Sporobacter termitidis]SHI20034.1 hypothetical protein SAMN02745823_03324 [Sporobacter termitidis DSM 10068]